MLVADKLVYLELKKTGCTHIVRLLQNIIDCKYVPPKHNHVAAKPVGKMLVGSVRSPWGYYVSLWAFGCQGEGGFRRRCLETGDISFRDALRPRRLVRRAGKGRRRHEWQRLYRDANDRGAFREWLVRIHDPGWCGDFGEGFKVHPAADVLGVMSYRYCKLHVSGFREWSDPPGSLSSESIQERVDRHHMLDATIRTERLSDDLIHVLWKAGYRISEDDKITIRTASPSNTSNHRKWQWYYEEAARALVEDKDDVVISRYGYQFDAQAVDGLDRESAGSTWSSVQLSPEP